MTLQILNGRYEIFDPTNIRIGAQGVVFFVKDKNENNEMYLLEFMQNLTLIAFFL